MATSMTALKENRLENNMILRKSVNISPLKKFALEELPKDSPLREILIAETSEIDVSTFLARLPIWVQLSKFKRSDH